jgi:RNA 2',3'-cyclic 3'-phosphodiesterase
MRLFVSIELPEDVRRHLGHIQKRLEPIIKAKWTALEQFHLTLKFLGETADSQITEIVDRLRAVRIEEAIRLRTGGVVCFPPHGPIRIIAAGMKDEAEACARLQAEIESACHAAGFALEGRAWKPHVTVGRVKDRTPAGARSAVIAACENLSEAEFEVDEFCLMQSSLDRNGPTYIRLATISSMPGRTR